MNSVFLPPIAELDRKAISLIRILAIFSVITAHTNTVAMESETARWILTRFWDAFGQVGVVCFFILGGFLYHREAKDSKDFLKKKIISLVIPWLVAAILTYSISCMLNHSINLVSALKWILGFETWYYYITVFLIFLFLFKVLWRRDALLYICMALTLCSIAVYTFFPSFTECTILPPYMNIFNWIGFFALGICARKFSWHSKINGIGVFLLAFAVAVCTLVLMFLLNDFGYFNLLCIPWELASSVILWLVARSLARQPWTNIFVSMGNDTYCIYLFHMQIVQFASERFPIGILSDIVTPFLCTALMLILVFLGKKLVCLLPFGPAMCRVVGLKVPPSK